MKYAHKHLVLAGLLAVFGVTAGAQMQPPSAAPDQGARPMAREASGGAEARRQLPSP